jgi:hypothetical protein
MLVIGRHQASTQLLIGITTFDLGRFRKTSSLNFADTLPAWRWYKKWLLALPPRGQLPVLYFKRRNTPYRRLTVSQSRQSQSSNRSNCRTSHS